MDLPLLLNLDSATSAAVSVSDSVPTSGTVSDTRFTTRQILDHAFRRCKMQPSTVSGENLEMAKEAMFLALSEMANDFVPLWVIERRVVGLTPGQAFVQFDEGVVDVLSAQVRRVNKLTATATSSVGAAPEVVDGDFNTFSSIGTIGGNFVLDIGASSAPAMLGVLSRTTGAWNMYIEVSTDALFWTQVYVNSALDVEADTWKWIEFTKVIPGRYIRLTVAAGPNLSIRELVPSMNPYDYTLRAQSRTEAFDMTSKLTQGRPVQYWLDKQRLSPRLVLWPVPSEDYKYDMVIADVQRHVQDVGSLSQVIEVPQRWYMTMINWVAKEIGRELPDVPDSVLARVDTDFANSYTRAMHAESDGSSTTVEFDIGGYTR